MIGPLKADGLLAKNWLMGAVGDAPNALLCGAGHNLRILRHLRVLCLSFFAWLGLIAGDWFAPEGSPSHTAVD